MQNNFPASKPTQTTPGTIPLKTNLMRVLSYPKVLHQYSVVFSPDVAKFLNRELFYRCTKDKLKVDYAYDGRGILVTAKKIKENLNLVFEYGIKKNDKKFTINYIHSYDMNELIAYCKKEKNVDITMHLLCLRVVCQGHQNKLGNVYNGKYFTPEGLNKLDSLLQIWTGLNQHLKVTRLGLVTNLDLSFQVMFEKCTLLELLVKFVNFNSRENSRRPPYNNRNDNNRNVKRGGENEESTDLKDIRRNAKLGGYNSGKDNRGVARDNKGNNNFRGDGSNSGRNERFDESQNMTFEMLYRNKTKLNEAIEELKTYLRKFKFLTNHLAGNRNIAFQGFDVSSKSAIEMTFELNSSMTSVADYFKSKYFKLKYPDLPCIVRKKGDKEFGYFPMEVLEINTNQKYTNKLTDIQTSAMIKVAAKSPTDRFRIIEQKAREFQISNNETTKAFNLVFEKSFLTCKGKILKSPRLEYGRGANQFMDVINGSWNLRGCKALEPVTIKNWIFAYGSEIRIREQEIQTGMDSFIGVCRNFGINLNNSFRIISLNDSDDIIKIVKEYKPMLIIVLLRDKSVNYYNNIKKNCETLENFVVTQCVVNFNFQKFKDPTFCSNIALKINVKLKGKNWKIADNADKLGKKTTIVFGADVTHQGIGDLLTPSISAVTASMDLTQNNYSVTINKELIRSDIIKNIGQIVHDSIINFISRNNKIPERILFFRDGIGESQFFNVYENEISKIYETCTQIKPNYKPKLTYIIAQKRHSVRFELLSNKGNQSSHQKTNASQNTGNVQPGTVVDEISHPYLYDFYMVSHRALQGTARPVRYQVLIDDNNFPMTEIQEIINNMCYQYPRATKAVSVVAPIYFAHLAAARARCYLYHDNSKEIITEVLDDKSNSSKPKVLEMYSINKNLEDQLFYM